MVSITEKVNNFEMRKWLGWVLGDEDSLHRRLQIVKQRIKQNISLNTKILLYDELVHQIIPEFYKSENINEALAFEREATEYLKPLLEERIFLYLGNMSVPEALKCVYDFGKKQQRS